MERLFSWEVTSVAVGIFISIGLGVLALDDFRLARLFFLFAAADAGGGVVMAGNQLPLPNWAKGAIVFMACGCVGFLALQSLRYVDRKENAKRAPEPAPTAAPMTAPPSAVPSANPDGDTDKKTAKAGHKATEQPPKPHPPYDARLDGDQPPTLADLFTKDFPYTMKYTMSDEGINFSDDGVTIPIKRQVYMDFAGKTKFVGFYVPIANPRNDRDNYDACMKLPGWVEQTFSDMNANASFTGGFSDQQESVKDLTFSGRVVLYHEDFLNITQKAAILEAFKTKGYDVTFVGMDYLQSERVAWALRHPTKN